MYTNETVNSAALNAAENGFDRVAGFTRLGRSALLRRLDLDAGSRVLEIGVDARSRPEETSIRDIDTAVDLKPISFAEVGLNDTYGLDFTFSPFNAVNICFAEDTFDAVVSAFGVMFASRPDRMVSEIHRVCKPGGLIALASWTPDSVIGQMFRLVSRYTPSVGTWPFLWGRSEWVRKCFGEALSDVEFSRHAVMMTFPFTVPAVVDLWLTYCHPLSAQLGLLKCDQQTDLRLDLEWLISSHNLAANEGTTILEAEYLQVKATRCEIDSFTDKSREISFPGVVPRLPVPQAYES